MTDNVLAHRGEGNVDVQPGGPGNNWKYLSACAYMSGPTVPHGGIERRWCQDARKANGFKVSSRFRTAPDDITFDLMTKLGKINFLADLGCPFGLRARYAACGSRWDTSNYDPLMLVYCAADLTEHSYEDLVIVDPGEQDEIVVTAPAAAASEYRVEKVEPARDGLQGTGFDGLGDQPINDIEYCDQEQCPGYCGDKSDGCTKIYGVTDRDTTPYAFPNLIKGVKNVDTGFITWHNYPIIGVNGNVDAIECAGSRLVISSNGHSATAYNDHDGDQDEWNVVVLAHAPTPSPNALYALNADIVWVVTTDGYVYKSEDGGATWTAKHQATITTNRLNAVFAYDLRLVYAVGNGGVILKSEDGGEVWQDMTEVATTAANLLEVQVPPERPKEVYVGTNTGQIFRSKDEGETFAEYTFDGSGVGSVDDIDFCGPCAGDVMFFLHNDGGPRGRILRDLSGGAGGKDVEVVSDYTEVIQAGVDLNALACCSVNEAIAAGENVSSYPVVIKVA